MFTTKIRNQTYPPLVFNNSYVEQFATQKHLELILDSRSNLQENLENVFKTANKSIALIRQFQIILTRPPLITIDKSLVRPYLDYLDIIGDQANNSSYYQKLESIQYNATPNNNRYKRNLRNLPRYTKANLFLDFNHLMKLIR